MRIVRILQIVALVLLAVYGAMLHDANPEPLALPWLVPMPPVLVLLLVAIVAFLAGWIPPRVRLWRRGRETVRLRRRVAELEQHLPSYDLRPSPPVIPDRGTAAFDPDAVEAPPRDEAT